MLLARLFAERYGKVVIIGDGVVGRHAARVADGMGAHVYLVGRHRERVPELKRDISQTIHFLLSEPGRIASELLDADLVVEKHGIIHYGVTNMPGAYPRLSTIALTRATLPYVFELATKGVTALREDKGLAKGVNTYQGHITCKPVAEAIDLMPEFRECL